MVLGFTICQERDATCLELPCLSHTDCAMSNAAAHTITGVSVRRLVLGCTTCQHRHCMSRSGLSLCTDRLVFAALALCCLVPCRSEREEDGPGVHLSEKDAAKAARKAAAMEKYAAQIRQLDDMVRAEQGSKRGVGMKVDLGLGKVCAGGLRK